MGLTGRKTNQLANTLGNAERLALIGLSHPVVAVTGLILLAAVLMSLFLADKSIWLDESFAYSRAISDTDSVWRSMVWPVAGNALYDLSLNLWVKLSGISEWALRGLSVLFALVTVPLVYALGARLFGSRVGITATLLLVVNAYLIRYAQEVRSYTLVIMLVTLSSYFFVKSIERPSWKNWAGYVICAGLTPYAHFLAILVFPAHAVSIVFLGKRGLPWRGLATSTVSLAVLWLPIVLTILRRLGREVGTPANGGLISAMGWIREPRLNDFYRLFYDLSGDGGRLLLLAYLIPCVITLLMAVRIWRNSGGSLDTWRYAFLLSWLFVPAVLGYLISATFQPMFISRYFIGSLPALVILVAIGLSHVRNRRLFVACLAIIIALSLRGVHRWYTSDRKTDWRGITSYVLSEARPGDAIIFHAPFIKWPFEYYLNRFDAPDGLFDMVELSWGPGVPDRLYLMPGLVELPLEPVEQGSPLSTPPKSYLDRLPAQYSGVWLVRSSAGSQSRQDEFIQTGLQRNYMLAQSQYFGHVNVRLYVENGYAERMRTIKD